MKYINGNYYKREKTAMGRKFWMRLTPEEVVEIRLYWVGMITAPFAMVWLLAWAAGMI